MIRKKVTLIFYILIHSLFIYVVGYLMGSLNFSARIVKGLYLGAASKTYEDAIPLRLLVAFISVTKTRVVDLCNAIFLIIILTIFLIIVVRFTLSRLERPMKHL